MNEIKTITLTIAGTDIRFQPTMQAYNRFVNEVMPADKVSPAHNYVRRIVVADDKAALDELLSRPGAALAIAGKINEQFAPELEIEVKN